MRNNQNIKDFFASTYCLLSLDQFDEGLWGKSMHPGKRQKFSIHTGRGSITVSSFAIDGILKYTGTREHPRIKKAVGHLSEHCNKVNGAFGQRQRVSNDPRVMDLYRVVENCRHTAVAARILMNVTNKPNKKAIDAISFVLRHQKPHGGWGIDPEPDIDDAECLTTAHVLQALFEAKRKYYRFLNDEDQQSLDSEIFKGMGWLMGQLKDTLWWSYKDIKEKKIQYTVISLNYIPELRRYFPKQYDRIVNNLINISGAYSGGLPSAVENKNIHLDTTAEFILALDNFHEKYKEIIERAYQAVLKNYKGLLVSTAADDWANLLSLCKTQHLKYQASKQELESLEEMSSAILANDSTIEKSPVTIWNYLPRQFTFLGDCIVGEIIHSPFREVPFKPSLFPVKVTLNKGLKSKLEYLVELWQSEEKNLWYFNRCPDFVDHGKQHALNVFNLLLNITSSQFFKTRISLNHYELFFLFCGTFLHDIGMTGTDKIRDCEDVRKRHGILSAKRITKEKLGLQNDEIRIVGELCKYHQSTAPLTEEELTCLKKQRQHILNEPIKESVSFIDKNGNDFPVSLRMLAALLRIADACDIGYKRAPRDFYKMKLSENDRKIKENNQEIQLLDRTISALEGSKKKDRVRLCRIYRGQIKKLKKDNDRLERARGHYLLHQSVNTVKYVNGKIVIEPFKLDCTKAVQKKLLEAVTMINKELNSTRGILVVDKDIRIFDGVKLSFN